jgi:hypothetical protein
MCAAPAIVRGTLRGILPIGDHWFMDAGLGHGRDEVDANGIGATIETSIDRYLPLESAAGIASTNTGKSCLTTARTSRRIGALR